MFGERKHNEGYYYTAAKSEKVERCVIESVYQEAHLPHDAYTRESFARAIVLEICHKNQMNWEQYVEDMWNRKKKNFDREGPTQYYKTIEDGDTFEVILKKRLPMEMG